MSRYIDVGNSDFRTIAKHNYVDKTELIAFVNSTIGTKDMLTCFTRPRRFGKSYAAQMLCAYYDKSCDSEELFTGYKIASDAKFKEHLNKHNVVYLDITWFISNAKIQSSINNIVSYIQQEVVQDLHNKYPNVPMQDSLTKMFVEIADRTGEKFIIIIDEWDAIFREAKENTKLQEEYMQLLRGLFKSGVQTNKIFEAAYITGILPIKKYGTQSSMTDFREYTMLSPGKLAKFIGFTQDEVKQICKENKLNFSRTKKWYDGYSFTGLKSIYNPNSVMEAVRKGEFGNYWTKSESYESLKLYIEADINDLQADIVQMLSGEKVKVDVETFQNDMTTIKTKDDVLTLLVHLGYLAYDHKSKAVYIPNEEIRTEFVRAVTTGKRDNLIKIIQNSDALLENVLASNEEEVAKAIENAHDSGAAPLFYNDEQALRAIIKFAFITAMDHYIRIEELPSGKGYADIVYLPKKSSRLPAMLVELKMNKSPEGAIAQIKRKNYPQVLKDYGSDILLVGVNYDDKIKSHTCKIERIVM